MKKWIIALLIGSTFNTSVFASTLSDKLLEEVKNNSPLINTSTSDTTVEELSNTFKSLYLYSPDFWNVKSELHFECEDKKVTKIFLSYTYPNADTKEIEIEEAVNKIAVQALELKNEYSKAKFVYNYLEKYFEYSKENKTVYDLVTYKTGNCHAFAQFYQLIMNKLNIPCESVVSENMQHQWNVVCIDGNWYNVDCSLATMCKNYHLYDTWYCKSDSYFTELGYTGGVAGTLVECLDKKYDK